MSTRPAHASRVIARLATLVPLAAVCAGVLCPGADLPSTRAQVRAATEGAPVLVGQIGGAASAVVLDPSGDRAYVAVGPRILVVDVSDPRAMHSVGWSDVLDGVVSAIAGGAGFVVAGGTRGELWTLTVGDPATPRLVGRATARASVADLALAGDRLFVAEGTRLDFFAASPPARLEFRGTVNLPRETSAIAVDGDRLAVTYGGGRAGGVWFFALSGSLEPDLRAEVDLSDEAVDVAFAGDLAFVLEAAALRVYDVRDLAAPVELGSVTAHDWGAGSPANRLAVAAATVYVAVGTVLDYEPDDLVPPPGGLEIIDVTQPARARVVGHYEAMPEDFSNGLLDVATSGDRVFALEPTTGLFAIDVSRPKTPLEIDRFETGGTAHDVGVFGDRAYVATGWAMRTVDVHDPGRCRWVEHDPAAASFAKVSGETLFTSRYGLFARHTWWRELRRAGARSGLDVSVEDVASAGSYAYLAGVFPGGGLDVYDLRNPERPVKTGSFFAQPGGPGPQDVAIAGGHLYARDMHDLYVYDLADPAHPAPVGSPMPLGILARRLAATGSLLVSGYGAGLAVIDVSTPEVPRRVGTVAFGEGAVVTDLAVDGQAVFAVAGDRLHVVDLTDPSAPREVADEQLPDHASGVDVSGREVYVAAGDAGLLVLRRTDAGVVSPTVPSGEATPTRMTQPPTAVAGTPSPPPSPDRATPTPVVTATGTDRPLTTPTSTAALAAGRVCLPIVDRRAELASHP